VHPRLRLSVAALAATALMTGLEVSSVSVILPSIGHDLRADFDSTQWVMNAYTIACTSILMVAGTLADRLGRRRIFTASMILFGAASMGCGMAPTMSMLIFCRVAQSAGGGAMLICLIAILSNAATGAVDADRAGMASGIETTVRYVALSTNIALMGLVLLIGVRSSLLHSAAGLDTAHAGTTAERLLTDGIGGDKIMAQQQALDRFIALRQGFETLTVYAGLAALFFAASSFMAFRRDTTKRAVRVAR